MTSVNRLIERLDRHLNELRKIVHELERKSQVRKAAKREVEMLRGALEAVEEWRDNLLDALGR